MNKEEKKKPNVSSQLMHVVSISFIAQNNNSISREYH